MGALTLSDLRPLDGEPCVQDLKLGAALGVSRVRDVRQLIERNLPELEGFGLARRRTAPITSGRGRQQLVTEYWLNEAQALLICMLARTPKAVVVRRQVIQVFLAWRHGELGPSPQTEAKNRPDPFDQLQARCSAALSSLQLSREIASGDIGLAQLPIFPSNRRPVFWGDYDVRSMITLAHRQMTIDQCRRGLIDRVGPDRTPGRSTIARYWQVLDRLRREAH